MITLGITENGHEPNRNTVTDLTEIRSMSVVEIRSMSVAEIQPMSVVEIRSLSVAEVTLR